jgi:hypothetical protein
MPYNMMIGYDIYDRCRYRNGAFSITSKNDIGDQNVFLPTVQYKTYVEYFQILKL